MEGMVFFLLLLTVSIVLLAYDRIRSSPPNIRPGISFLIPCYDDAETIHKTITTIQKISRPGDEIIVVDDGSQDGSSEILASLQDRERISVHTLPVNQGKSTAINTAMKFVRHEIIAMVDADVFVNERAFQDALSRLENSQTAAVSCPCIPANSGFLPLLQQIEYNMFSLFQIASNPVSVLSLRGGCILIKKSALSKVGGLSVNAITEDLDLACKLNSSGFRIKQSYYPVQTAVPDSLQNWIKQKIRWGAGTIQCILGYPRVWLLHPLIVILSVSYIGMIFLNLPGLIANVVFWDGVMEFFQALNQDLSLLSSLRITWYFFGFYLLHLSANLFTFSLCSLPFALPIIKKPRNVLRGFLIIPYSIAYVPLLTITTLLGGIKFLASMKRYQEGSRAW